MRMEITDESGHLMLDGELMPGLFDGLDVEGQLEVDEQSIPGSSETSRQVQGYKPRTLVFKVTLPTDEDSTCFDKLRIWTARFQSTDAAARPYIRRLVNEHTAAWGIDEVLFRGLRSSDDNKADSLKLEIRFEEWRPTAVRKEAAVRTGTPPLDPELQRLLGYGQTASNPQPVYRALVTQDSEPTPE